MASSPTDRHLAELAELYDRSLEALMATEDDRLATLLDRCEAIIEAYRDAIWPASDRLTKARESHGRLSSAMSQVMDRTKGELSRLRRGRNELRRFFSGAPTVGTRLHDEA